MVRDDQQAFGTVKGGEVADDLNAENHLQQEKKHSAHESPGVVASFALDIPSNASLTKRQRNPLVVEFT